MAEINKNPKLQTDKRKSSHSLPSILLGIKGKGNKRERYKRNRIGVPKLREMPFKLPKSCCERLLTVFSRAHISDHKTEYGLFTCAGCKIFI